MKHGVGINETLKSTTSSISTLEYISKAGEFYVH